MRLAITVAVVSLLVPAEPVLAKPCKPRPSWQWDALRERQVEKRGWVSQVFLARVSRITDQMNSARLELTPVKAIKGRLPRRRFFVERRIAMGIGPWGPFVVNDFELGETVVVYRKDWLFREDYIDADSVCLIRDPAVAKHLKRH